MSLGCIPQARLRGVLVAGMLLATPELAADESSAAFCGVLWGEYADGNVRPIIRVVPGLVQFTPQQLKELRDLVASVHGVLGGLVRPELTYVALSPTGTSAYFQNPLLRITVPARLALPTYLGGPLEPLPPKVARLIQAHEYGHRVFHENLGAVVPRYRRYLEYTKANARHYAERVAPLEAEHAEAGREAIKNPDKQARSRLAEIDAAIEKAHSEAPKPVDPPYARDLQTHYDELFADVIAVAYAGGPQEAVKGLDEALPTIPAFTKNIPAKTWRIYDRPWGHMTLNPTRSFLGREILTDARLGTKTGETVTRIFRVIAAEIEARHTTPKLKTLTASEMNERLIDALKVEFAR